MASTDKKIRIGLFDSGRGGFSILAELLRTSDQFDCFYFADLHHHPYGPKTDGEILERSHAVVKHLLAQQVDLIVVACNTATAVAIDELRSTYPHLPFVGIEPFLAAYEQLTRSKEAGEDDRFSVLVTASMGKSRRFQALKKRRDPEDRIHVHICPQLASLVERAFEEGWTDRLQELAEVDLAALLEIKPDYAILGCTHYPLIKDQIAQFLGAKTLSPCAAVVKRVFSVLAREYPKDFLSQSQWEKQQFSYTDSEHRAFELRQAARLSF